MIMERLRNTITPQLSEFFTGKNSPPSPLLLTRPETNRLETVLFKQYGRGGQEIRLGKTKEGKGWKIDPQVDLGEGRGIIVIERVEPQETTFTNNHLFNTALSKLPEDDQRLIRDYLGNQNNKVLALRRTEPSNKFLTALTDWSERHLGGFSPLTVATVVYYTFKREEKPPEKLKDLQQISQEMTPVHFFPISRLKNFSKEEWRRLNEAFKKLNAISDPFEFIYDVFLATAKLQGMEAVLSGVFLGGGACLLPFLPASENQWAMFGSQLAGETLTLFFNQFDRLIHLLPPYFKKFLRQMGIILANNNSLLSQTELTSLEKQVARINKLISFLSLALATGFAFGLTNLSLETHNSFPFFLIAPLNSTLLSLSEIGKRTLAAWAFLKTQEQQVKEAILNFLKIEKPQLEKILTECPPLAVAIIDFLTNRPAFYAWLSTYASFLLYLVNCLHPLPMNINETFTGLIFEGGGGLTGARSTNRKDPWQIFQRLLPHLSYKD